MDQNPSTVGVSGLLGHSGKRPLSRAAARLIWCVLVVLFWLVAVSGHAATYTVKRNDTLSRIARAHGVATSELAAANDISLNEIIRPGQRLSIPSGSGSKAASAPKPEPEPDRVVIVRKHDSLSLIARTHGVDVSDLANANGVSLKRPIYPGQRLVIPSGPVAAPLPDLPSSIQRAIQRAPVRAGRWRHIVIHHSATREGSVRGMDEYHRRQRNMENGLAYHFVIGNGRGMRDGEIAVGRRWIQQIQGGHVSGEHLNEISLGICLVGDFEKSAPTRRQLDSLDALLQSLMARCNLSAKSIQTHSQINPAHTRCPGRRFDIRGVHRRLSS